MAKPRTAEVTRETKETKIALRLNLDGEGRADFATGIPFFGHMLELLARHGLFDIALKAEGDLNVDYHHTVEDAGIVLGQALKKALGDKRGIRRYGFFILPMDETLARAAVDLGGRAALVYQVDLKEPFVRDFNTGLFRDFFQAFADAAGANVHLAVEYGDEAHHAAEAVFKAFAKALDMATRPDPRQAGQLPSTKGLLV